VTEEHEHVIDDLGAYVLDSLDGAERTRIEVHVATCAICARQLAEYRAVGGVLPVGLPLLQPPPAAWAVIRAATRERQPRGRAWTPADGLRAWLRIARWPAMASLVVALATWNVALQWQMTHPPYGPDVEALSRRPGRMVIFAGTGAPGASARLFVAVDGGHGHLAVSGLRPLPRERTYQLWFLSTRASALTGATFGADARGRAWVKVAAPPSLDEVRAIAITEEPAPGSAAPTGPHLLEAQAWR
jgi:anti-sigma-K factor RskA